MIHSLLGLLVAFTSTAQDVSSFTSLVVPSRRLVGRRANVMPTKAQHTSALFAIGGSYLDSLSKLANEPAIATLRGQSTEEYLNSLSQVMTSTTLLAEAAASEDFSAASASQSLLDNAISTLEAVEEATAIFQDASTSNSIQQQAAAVVDEATTAIFQDATTSSNLFQAQPEQVAEAVAAASPSIEQQQQAIEQVTNSIMASSDAIAPNNYDVVYHPIVQQMIADASSSVTRTLDAVADTSVYELAQNVVTGLQAVGNFLFDVLETLLETTTGTTLAEVLTRAQASVAGVVDTAVQNALDTFKGIGQMNISDAAESLVALVTMVAKVLFALLSVIVKTTSGKGINEWALTASGMVEQKASALTAQASATAADLSQKSLNELSTMVVGFSQDVGQLMAGSLQALGNPAVAGGAGSEALSGAMMIANTL